jgi:predicted PurR-regulated permease PerM
MEDQSSTHSTIVRRSLVVIASLAVTFFLEWASSVLVPLVFALFLVAVFWPLYRWIASKTPSAIAAVSCALVFVGLVYGLGFGLFACAEYVAHQEQLSDYEARVSELRGYLVGFGKKVGIPEDQLSVGSTKDEILGAIKPIQSFIVGGTLTVAFLALGLAEVRSYKKRFDSHAPEKSAQLANVMDASLTTFSATCWCAPASGF